MPNLDELKAKLNDLSNNINAAIQANDTPTAAKLQQEYQDVQAQINQAEVEGITQDVAASIETFTVGDTTFTLDQLAADEDAASIIRMGLQKIEATVAEKATAWVNDLQAIKADYEAKLADRDAQLRAIQAQNDSLQQENGQLVLERDDIAEKRDAAVKQAEEAAAEVARLNSQVDDLRKEIAVGATNAAKVIDITSTADLEAAAARLKAKREADAKAAREAAEAAKIRVYDKQAGDLMETYYTAKRLDNDEEIRIPYLELNKYVVVGNEEAERFRQERQAAEEALVESIPAAEEASEPVMPEVPQFQYDETTQAQPTDGLVGDASDTQVVGKTVEERLTELEGRVIELERKAANPQPAVWAS